MKFNKYHFVVAIVMSLYMKPRVLLAQTATEATTGAIAGVIELPPSQT